MSGTDIVRTEGVLGGEPRLDGRRISVIQIADMVYEADWSPAEVATQLAIPEADVETALDYYENHPEEMEQVRARHAELEELLRERATPPPDRPDA